MVLKVPSTPDDPASSVLQGLATLLDGVDPDTTDIIVGSTVATNALLERKGARVLLITNAGFEDVIEIGRQNRPDLYALSTRVPPPLVARPDRVGVAGRMDETGREIRAIDPAELEGLRVRAAEVEAVAVVLLHSYANDAHERAVARALVGIHPPISLSSAILPEFREYERTSTTVTNAYVAPIVRRYLAEIERGTGHDSLRVMGSSGGALLVEQAVHEPVHTVLSGPAGGVVGAFDWAQRSGVSRVLSFDMGGTSTDVSLISGALGQTREGEIGGLPISIPLMDIHTVGAGGGSIVGVDPGGGLRVGPESAGADPGPICYGRGGDRITVTDANVYLGRLPASGLLGGTSPLDRDAVTGPMHELARQAGLEPVALAEGIIRVVDTAMERALRVISVERGVDPAGFHLVAFGGAAGLHAAEMSRRLNLLGALIPPNPGLLSAFGMLVAPVVRDRSRTVLGVPSERLPEILDGLEEEAREEMERDGAESVSIDRAIDARYRGQSFELRVPADGWPDAFHQAHAARYGYRRDSEVEAVTVRVRAEAPGVPMVLPPTTVTQSGPERIGVHYGGDVVQAISVERASLPPGERREGPLVVREYSSTTWCPPGWGIVRDEAGVLHLTRS